MLNLASDWVIHHVYKIVVAHISPDWMQLPQFAYQKIFSRMAGCCGEVVLAGQDLGSSKPATPV